MRIALAYRVSAAIGLLCTLSVGPLHARQHPSTDEVAAAVWLDMGRNPVLHAGDEVRIYYRVSGDAHVALLHVRPDGEIRMIFPMHPDVQPRIPGGRVYRLLPSIEPSWRVGDVVGWGGFVIVASSTRLDLTGFRFQPRSGWSLDRPDAPLPFRQDRLETYLGGLLSGGEGQWAVGRAGYQVVQRSDDPGLFRYLRPLDPRARARPRATLRRRPPARMPPRGPAG